MFVSIRIKSRLLVKQKRKWKIALLNGSSLVAFGAALVANPISVDAYQELINPAGATVTGAQYNVSGTTSAYAGQHLRIVGTADDYRIENHGSVDISNTTGNLSTYGGIASPGAAGSSANLLNTGTVTVANSGANTSNNVFGLEAISSNTGSTSTIANRGTVSVSSTYANSTVRGMSVNSTVDGSATNTGTITVASAGNAIGVASWTNGATNKVQVSNTGTISVSSSTTGRQAHQLLAGGSGTTQVTAWAMDMKDYSTVGTNQRAFAASIDAKLEFDDGAGNGTHLILSRNGAEHVSSSVMDMVQLYNNATASGFIGSIASPDTSADQYQMTLEGYADYQLQDIYIDRATQVNTVGSTRSGAGCAFATCALYSSTHGLGVNNAGTVDVAAAVNGIGTGLFVNLRDTGTATTVNMINMGTVGVTASGTGAAYGLHARLQGADQVAEIDSNETVTVTGPTAHQLFVQGRGGGFGGTGHLNRWNLALQDWASDAVRPFAVADSATLNFNNTHLIVRPGLDVDGFVMGKRYAIADMVSNTGGTVTGAIGSVSTPLPMLFPTLEGKNWDTATVALNVVPQVSPGQIVNAAQTSFMRGQFNLLDAMLLSADATDELSCEDDPRYCRKKTVEGGDASSPVSLHVRPYYNHQSRDGFSGAATDATGVVLLGSREMDDGHRLGVHGGAGYANTLSNDKTLRSDAMTGLLGIHGIYHVRSFAYLRGQLSGAVSVNNNHFSDIQGTDWASNNAVGTGMYGALYGGHRLRLKSGDIILPEVGLTASWIHSPAMDINWKHNQDLNMSYKANDYVVLNGQASVRWIGKWDVGGTHLYPTVLAGVRQALTSTNIRASMSFSGQHFNSAVKEDRTLGLGGIGLTVPLGETTSLSAAYFGEIGKTMTNHSGFLNLKMVF